MKRGTEIQNTKCEDLSGNPPSDCTIQAIRQIKRICFLSQRREDAKSWKSKPLRLRAFARSKNVRVSAIVFIFPVLLFVGACSEPETKPPSEAEIVEALAWSEIAEIKTKTHNDKDFSSEPVLISLDQQIERIERQTDSETKNRDREDLVRQLLFENRFDKATELAVRITDSALRDPLLEDIARFQVQNAFRLYQGTVPPESDGRIPESVLLPIRQAIDTAGHIEDPLIYAETIGNIALFQNNMKDREGVAEMMPTAVETVLQRSGGGPRKARALLLLADWFLRQDDKDTLKTLCEAAEIAMADAAPDYESALLLFEIVTIGFLTDQHRRVDKICNRIDEISSTLTNPRQKVSALIRMGETLLLLTGKDETDVLPKRLKKIKQLALEIDAIVREPSFPSTKSEAPVEAASPVLPGGREAMAMKNRILRQVVAIQAWKAPLEDVWDTIEQMDHGPDRDVALSTTIDMMLATQTTDDAQAWAEEISDPEKRRAVLQKLSNQ